MVARSQTSTFRVRLTTNSPLLTPLSEGGWARKLPWLERPHRDRISNCVKTQKQVSSWTASHRSMWNLKISYISYSKLGLNEGQLTTPLWIRTQVALTQSFKSWWSSAGSKLMKNLLWDAREVRARSKVARNLTPVQVAMSRLVIIGRHSLQLLIWLVARGWARPAVRVCGWRKLRTLISQSHLSVTVYQCLPVTRTSIMFLSGIQNWQGCWQIAWEEIPRRQSAPALVPPWKTMKRPTLRFSLLPELCLWGHLSKWTKR